MAEIQEWFAKLMAGLASGYQTRLRDGMTIFYASHLQRFPPAAVELAMQRAAAECSFFPTVADIRKHLVPPTDEAALVAWAALTRAASLVGAYQSLQVADQCAAEALLTVFGSWPAFCAAEDGPALGHKRQEFLAVYRQRRRAQAQRSVPVLLEGLTGARGGWCGHVLANGEVRTSRQPLLPAGEPRVLGA